MASKPKTIDITDADTEIVETILGGLRFKEKEPPEIEQILRVAYYGIRGILERNSDEYKIGDIETATKKVLEWEKKIKSVRLGQIALTKDSKIFIPMPAMNSPIQYLLACASSDHLMAYPMRFCNQAIAAAPTGHIQKKFEHLKNALYFSRVSESWTAGTYLGYSRNNVTEGVIQELDLLNSQMKPLIKMLQGNTWEPMELFNAYAAPRSKPTRLYYYASIEMIYRLLCGTYSDLKPKAAAMKANSELKDFFQSYLGLKIDLDEVRKRLPKIKTTLPEPGPQIAKLLALQDYLRFLTEKTGL